MIDFRLIWVVLLGLGVETAPEAHVADAGTRGGGIPSCLEEYSDSLSFAACGTFVPLFQLRLNFLRKEEPESGVSGVSRSWNCSSSLCFFCLDLSLGIGSLRVLEEDLGSEIRLLSGP